jgi:hypothetical protein
MTAYSLLRLAHGYWRWAVLVLAIVVLVRAIAGVRTRREWTGIDERATRRFLSALDVQFLLGVVLYLLSPFSLAMYQAFQATMRTPDGRFCGAEHGAAMLLAMVAAHVGRVRVKRAPDNVHKHRAMLIAMVIFFALVVWAIPWPWRVFGRPLFRTVL